MNLLEYSASLLSLLIHKSFLIRWHHPVKMEAAYLYRKLPALYLESCKVGQIDSFSDAEKVFSSIVSKLPLMPFPYV